MRGRRASVAAVALCLLSACTSSEQPASTQPSPTQVTNLPTSRTVATPTSEQPQPSETPTGTPSSPTTSPDAPTQPLALAVSVHRPPVRLTLMQARSVLAGDVARWSELGQPGGRLVVHRGRTALAVVARREDALAVVPASELTPIVQTATVAGIDPLREPDSYPITTSSTGRPPVVTTVTVVGDIMLGRRVAAASPDNPGAALEPMRRYLARADLTIGNLESTLSTDGAPRQGDDSFAADPAVLSSLGRAGFDLLTLANNHTGDYGETALRQTLRSIDRSPLRRVGAGRNAREAWRPAVLRHQGVSFGFLAFNAIGETPRATAHSPGSAEIRMQPRTGPLNSRDLSRMTRGITRLAERVDVVVVMPHWGDQYTNQPVPAQRRVGAALIDAGADLVVGGHPHVVQGVQPRDDRLIVHSLGNFIFDMDFSVPTQEGVVLELVFWDARLRGVRLTPYVIGADFAPRLVDGPRAAAILARIWATSDGPFRR